jgi:hypothetical protein
LCGNVGDYAVDLDLRVKLSQLALSSRGFRQRLKRVTFVKKSLPLQIRWLDEVAVNDAKSSDAGAGQQLSGGSADGATAHDNRTRCQQATLAFLAHTGEENLPRVSFKSGVDRQDE